MAAGLVIALALEIRVGAATLVWNPNPETDLGGYFVYVTSPDQDLFERRDTGLTNAFDLSFGRPGESFSFFVTAFNQAGIESDPSETVFWEVPYPPGWPRILIQPEDISAKAGEIESLFLHPSGPEVEVQWFKDNVALTGQTNLLLFFAPLRESDAGIYTAVVRNEIGEVRSRRARLEVLTAPRILSQMTRVEVQEGMPVELSVEVAGGQPLTFTWFRGDTIVEDQGGPWLFLPEVMGQDAGVYTVRVRNPLGSVESGPIELVVEVPGSPAQLQILAVPEGLSVRIEGTPGAIYDIEQSTSLNSEDWTRLDSRVLDSSGVAFVDFSSDLASRFIRVRPRWSPWEDPPWWEEDPEIDPELEIDPETDAGTEPGTDMESQE